MPYLQTQDGKTYTGLYRHGDMLITPANTPLFVRWEGNENCLQIQLPEAFLKRVAEETLGKNGDRLTLVPTFHSRNQQLEAIAPSSILPWSADSIVTVTSANNFAK